MYIFMLTYMYQNHCVRRTGQKIVVMLTVMVKMLLVENTPTVSFKSHLLDINTIIDLLD